MSDAYYGSAYQTMNTLESTTTKQRAYPVDPPLTPNNFTIRNEAQYDYPHHHVPGIATDFFNPPNSLGASQVSSKGLVSYDPTTETSLHLQLLQESGGNLSNELDPFKMYESDGYGATGQDFSSDAGMPMSSAALYSLGNMDTGPSNFGFGSVAPEDPYLFVPPRGRHYDDADPTQTSGYHIPGQQTTRKKPAPVVCDLTDQCKRQFLPSSSKLQRHIDKYHPELTRVPEGQKIKCPKDGTMVTPTNFSRHVLDKHFGVYKVHCEICRKRISRADNLDRHNAKYHKGIQVVKR